MSIVRPERCSSCPFKTLTCGSRGPKDSPFVIVGESPGSREIAKGLPFIGPSGQMLMDVLKEVGYDERIHPKPYVLNALQCMPIGDKAALLATATSACKSRLAEELGRHPRTVILALGAAATWSITGNYNLRITRDRGKVLPTPYADGGVVLAVHPAYLMRNGVGLPFWKRDLKQAVDILNGEPYGDWHEPEWRVLSERNQLEWMVRDYTREGTKLTTGDVETDDLSAFNGRLLSLGITKGNGRHVDIIPEEIIYDNWDLMKVLLESPNCTWNWHNGKFDIAWFWRALRGTLPRIEARVDEDTLLMSYALNSNRGFHDLDQVAQNWIRAPAHKGAIDKYLPYKGASYRNIPKPELYKYQAFDVSKTHQQHGPLHRALEDDGPKTLRLYTDILIPGSKFFAELEHQGIALDLDRVRQNYELHQLELQQIDAELQTYAREYMGREINFASPIQLRELMYRYMKLGPNNCIWDKESTDEKHLIEVQRRTNHPMVHTLLKRREVAKRCGTYVSNMLPVEEQNAHRKKGQRKIKAEEVLFDSDGRVRASFMLHGTATGRPACRDPNLLNMPRGPLIRTQFVARPGHIIIEVDLNQAELRSLALMSGDPLLMDIYTKNEVSIHDVTTGKFFGSKQQMKESVEVMEKAAHLLQYFGELTPDRVYAEAKMRGKAVNFGIVYGREAHSLAQEFAISHQEAQRWIDEWLHDLYPVAGQFIKRCRDTVRLNQTMSTVFGRKKRLGVVSPEKQHDYENESANFPHQSTAHDIILCTGIEVQPVLKEKWDARIWNEVYDALYIEAPAEDETVSACISYIQSVVARVPRDWGLTRVPFIGDAKVGYTWGTMKDWKGSIAASLN